MAQRGIRSDRAMPRIPLRFIRASMLERFKSKLFHSLVPYRSDCFTQDLWRIAMPFNIVVMVGLVAGMIIILCVCHVYVKDKKLDKSAYILVVVSLILIGMSVWEHIIVQVGDNKIDLLKKNIDQVQEAVDKQKSDMEILVNCAAKNMNIKITEPTLHQVSSTVDVRGSSAYNEVCRWAYVLVRDKDKVEQPWIVKDIVQISRDGHWAGRAMLDNISKEGGEAELLVGVSYLPNVYKIYQSLESLPDTFSFSGVVNLRRTK